MKKRFLGILLSISLIVSFVPASVFADTDPTIIMGDLDEDAVVTTRDAVLLQKYLEGEETLNDNQKALADMDNNGVIDIKDLTALQENANLPTCEVNVTNGYASVARTKVNKAASTTKVTITAEAPAPGMKFIRWEVGHGGVRLDNVTAETTFFEMPANNVTVRAVFEDTPDAEEITLTIPYKTTVVQKGNVKPGETLFNLEFINGDGTPMNIGEEGSFKNVKVTASVATNGAGDYPAKMTITGTFKQLNDLLGEGALVRQIDDGKKGWIYDDAVWAVFMIDDKIVEMAESDGSNADGVAEYSAVIFPTVYEDKNYSIDWNEADMSFENVYDVSTYVEYDGAAGGDSDKNNDSDSAKTGDDTNLVLWIALMLLAGAGITGTAVYTRRKRTNE